jgi:D-alanyl-D-alanine carboxypeptidase
MRLFSRFMIKRLYILCFFCLWLIPAKAFGISADQLYSPSAILVDMNTGAVLFEKNADEARYPASLTKVLTAIVALENVASPDTEMYSSKEALKGVISGGMHIFIWDDEVLKFYDLLHALLIPSANDAANIIAHNTFGDTQAFISRMNERARELGAVNTRFTNPSGLHQAGHSTTARDMSILARHAMSFDLFREIAGKTDYLMSPTNRHAQWDELHTSNTFLYAESEYFTKVTGVKTGYTDSAGFTLIASAQNNQGMELLAVTMGAGSRSATNRDARTLLEYGFQNFEPVAVVNAGDFLTKTSIPGADEHLSLLFSKDLSLLKRKDESLALSYELKLDDNLAAPVSAGQVVGSADYFNDGILVASVPVEAAGDVGLEIDDRNSERFFGRLSAAFGAISGGLTGLSAGLSGWISASFAGLIPVVKVVFQAVGILLFLFILLIVIGRICAARRRKKRRWAKSRLNYFPGAFYESDIKKYDVWK